MNSRRGGLALARRSMVVGSQVGSAPMPNTPPHVSQRLTPGAEIGLPRELHLLGRSSASVDCSRSRKAATSASRSVRRPASEFATPHLPAHPASLEPTETPPLQLAGGSLGRLP
jgi:hypothetical protein